MCKLDCLIYVIVLWLGILYKPAILIYIIVKILWLVILYKPDILIYVMVRVKYLPRLILYKLDILI